MYFALNETLRKVQIFQQNHGLTTLQKSQFCGFLKPTFSLFRKACLLYKTSKIVFHDLFSRSKTWEYRGLQGVTGGYRGLQGVSTDYRGLQGVSGVTGGGKEVTGGYKGF